MSTAESKRGGVTLKAVLVGLVFVLLECGLVHYVDQVIHGTLTMHLVPAPGLIVLLFVLVWGINTPLRTVAPRWALTTREILVVYCMMAVGFTAPSVGLAQVLVCIGVPGIYLDRIFERPYSRPRPVLHVVGPAQSDMRRNVSPVLVQRTLELAFGLSSSAPFEFAETDPLVSWGEITV